MFHLIHFLFQSSVVIVVVMVMLPSFTALIEKTDETMCVTLASTELAKCHNPQKQARTFGRLQSKL